MGVGQAAKVETQMCKIAWSTEGPTVAGSQGVIEIRVGDEAGKRDQPHGKKSFFIVEQRVHILL